MIFFDTNKKHVVNNKIVIVELLTFTLSVIFAFISIDVYAGPLYKYKDEMGITRYSENPPVKDAQLVTPDELVNAKQAKDICANPITIPKELIKENK